MAVSTNFDVQFVRTCTNPRSRAAVVEVGRSGEIILPAKVRFNGAVELELAGAMERPFPTSDKEITKIHFDGLARAQVCKNESIENSRGVDLVLSWTDIIETEDNVFDVREPCQIQPNLFRESSLDQITVGEIGYTLKVVYRLTKTLDEERDLRLTPNMYLMCRRWIFS